MNTNSMFLSGAGLSVLEQEGVGEVAGAGPLSVGLVEVDGDGEASPTPADGRPQVRIEAMITTEAAKATALLTS